MIHPPSSLSLPLAQHPHFSLYHRDPRHPEKSKTNFDCIFSRQISPPLSLSFIYETVDFLKTKVARIDSRDPSTLPSIGTKNYKIRSITSHRNFKKIIYKKSIILLPEITLFVYVLKVKTIFENLFSELSGVFEFGKNSKPKLPKAVFSEKFALLRTFNASIGM